jgi:hypothetical protein
MTRAQDATQEVETDVSRFSNCCCVGVDVDVDAAEDDDGGGDGDDDDDDGGGDDDETSCHTCVTPSGM